MALWKPFRGNRTALDTVEKRDGFVYFCTDDGSLFFDYLDANGVLQRKQINAKEAETLAGASLEELKKSISWDDLLNKPTIPTVPTKVSAFENDKGYLTEHQSLEGYAKTSELFSKDYNDLTNKPNIPVVPTNISAFTNDVGYLKSYTETDPTVPEWAKAANKPSYNLGEISDTSSYVRMTPAERTKLSNISAGAEVNVQSDWNITDTSSDAYIKNKPTLGSLASKSVVNKTDLAASIQTSLGKADTALQSFTEIDPTVPNHVKNITEDDISSWNAKSEFSGSYNDLTNKPTIPTVNNATLTIQKNGTTVKTFTANSATDVTANITVPTKTSELTNDSGFKTTDTNTTYSLSKSGSTITLTGSDGSTTSVSDTDTNTTYNIATSSTAGLVKIGYTENGKNYPVELSEGKMFVNVPWTDNNTIYTHPASGVTAGSYTKVTVDANGHVTSGDNPTTLAGYGITDGEAKGTASTAVSTHNTSTSAHNDIRDLISGLTDRLNAVANSTDKDLDQLAEIVAYIKANKGLIDGITTSKVNVADIINNLTTNVSNKPLSAAQGVVIKGLIDDLQSALNTHTTNPTVHITAAERTNWNTAKTKIDALGISYDSSSNTVTFS